MKEDKRLSFDEWLDEIKQLCEEKKEKKKARGEEEKDYSMEEEEVEE